MSNLFSITLAKDGFCIASSQVKALRRIRPIVTAQLIGLGINEPRKFAPLLIEDKLYFADHVTGTLFDENGEHHTDIHLRVEGLPAINPHQAVEVD